MSTKPAYRETSWKIRNQHPALPGSYANILRWLDRELPAEELCGSLLEVGCAAAFFTPHLARRAEAMRACDPSAEQIALNCKEYPAVSFFVQDPGESIAAEFKTFDVLFCSRVLDQLINPSFALHQFYRVLKPGGRLLITVNHHGFFKNLLIALFGWSRHFAPESPQLRFFTRRMLSRLAHKIGFRDIRIESCGRGRPLRDLGIPSSLLLSAKK